MIAHTPGPWNFRRVNNVDHYRCVPTDAQDRELLKAVPIDRIAEVEANARLIAAAPAMLDALKGCERVTKAWLEDMKDYPLVNPEKAAATMELIRIQEAIRLAEGRP